MGIATVALYVRIPVELRTALEELNRTRHNGYPRRGDLTDTMVRALQAGLVALQPVPLAPAAAELELETAEPKRKHARKLRELNDARARARAPKGKRRAK